MTSGTTPAVAVVVTQRLAPGAEADYEQWQSQVDHAAGTVPGFLGTEAVIQGDDERDRSVIYRFDSTKHLKQWLDSSARHDLIAGGAHLFEQPPAQHVVVGHDDDPVTVVVTHRVTAETETAFLAWQERITQVEQSFPGFRGSELLPPVPGVQQEWAILTTFDTAPHLDAWLESPERKALLADGKAFSDFQVRRIASPYGSWFGRRRGAAPVDTPDWKSALSVLVGLYPTVVLLTLALGKIWPDAPLWASLLVGNILSVSVLTWVVMPNVTRFLAFWLEPGANASRRNDVIGAVVSVAFVTLAAIAFWLVTTVIWTLP